MTVETPTTDSYGLRHQVLSPLETLGQSVANIAPTGTPTVVIPLVFAAAGAGTWFAYLFALVGVLLVSFSINQFARRSASPGSIYSYIAIGLGPNWGIAAGWTLLIAYIGCASSVTSGFAIYANVFIKDVFNLTDDLPAVWLVGLILISVVGAWFVAWKDIKLSARLTLGLELTSVVFILVVVVATLIRLGFHIDWSQLRLEGLSLDSLRLGLVLAIFSFTGFESAAALGAEAKAPLRSIPRAIWQSALLVDDVDGLKLDDFSATNAFPEQDTPAVLLDHVKNANIDGSVAPEGTNVFLKITGADSHDLHLFGNDFHQAKVPYVLGPDVKADGVTALDNFLPAK